ncbi:hypothetical protein FKV24_015240 [Lysobacter maris]|uniref:Uncharacterized protein n=1 Tax=Marilutibacter maris TaxID=1605891 RepID=A0A508AB65_9GAMM|nr:hypothetical protein [Lysobacter maris]KAB8172194.1 hypothetical protein FKV24_015240 [Lysobacter maris]
MNAQVIVLSACGPNWLFAQDRMRQDVQRHMEVDVEIADSIEALGHVELHDAVLYGIDLRVFEGICEVRLSMYETPESSSRIDATLSMTGVESCLMSVDTPSLLENASAGNVANCRVDVDRGVVRLYLTDGLLEVFASAVSLARDPAQ